MNGFLRNPEERKARDWLKTAWSGESFMAVGVQDPVLGPPAMKHLRKIIKGCPPSYEMEAAGHFVQEWAYRCCQGPGGVWYLKKNLKKSRRHYGK